MILRLSALVFAAFTLGFAGASSAEVLECNLKTNARSGGWVTKVYIFEYDPYGSKARGFDAVIKHFEGAPIEAKITENTGKRMVLNWSLATSNKGQSVRMRFRAAYFKANKAVTIRAFPDSAYVGDFSADGTCKVVK